LEHDGLFDSALVENILSRSIAIAENIASTALYLLSLPLFFNFFFPSSAHVHAMDFQPLERRVEQVLLDQVKNHSSIVEETLAVY
jgi:hypothetical protein